VTAATDGFHDWAPLDDYKTTICGQLATFGIFEPTRERKILQFLPEIPEHDWNIIIIPTRRSVFDERFKLATKLMERGRQGDLLSCFDRDNPCFEAEVTPQRNLLRANTAGRWLSACRTGQRICVFGPWVGDGGHGFRPEIHPAERIWWRGEDDRLRLLFVQDASQRFGDRRQFQWRWGQTERGNWRPWAGPGLQGEFRVAFQAERGSTVSLAIEQLLDTNTRTTGRSAGNHRLFPLKEGGQDFADVKVDLGLGSRSDRLELDLSKLDVSIKPTDVCRRQNGKVQGYVTIHDKTGYGYQEGEGFDAFEVTLPAIPEESEPETVKHLDSEPAAESLHASVLVTAQEERTAVAAGALRARLLDDLLSAAFLKRLPFGEPPAPEVQQTEARERMAVARTDVVIGFTRRFRVTARPHYDGPRGERLEGAIRRARRLDLARLLEAAPAPVPYRVKWDVEVRDAATGARLPDDRVTRTCKRPRLLVDDDCVLELPPRAEGGPPDRVLHLSAKATLVKRDDDPIPSVTLVGAESAAAAVGGDKPAEQEIRLASHFIRATERDSAEKVLAWLEAANPSSGNIVAAGSPPKGERPPDQETRPNQRDLDSYRQRYHARMLRHGVALATTDGRVTVDELAQFVDMAAAFGDLPPLTRVQAAPKVK
jgi:hypothetical protein